MAKKQLLPFIKNEDLYKHVKMVLNVAKNATNNAEKKIYSNVIDPFSALFDASNQNISLSEWIKQEKSRQTQKTLQNAIGEFHQNILGSMSGWENLKTGSVSDLSNKNKKIIAEVKNKYNTTKGNHKTAIYDDFKKLLKKDYKGYEAYYVEIIPKGRNVYNKPFTPPDNRTGKRRPKNIKIKIIDGKTFYDLASGYPESLKQLYLALPTAISNVLGKKVNKVKSNEFVALFKKAY
ncbi:MAG TPA: Eco47II family restriction endonuclease [Candidatus Moranbacteria bacterium]|nr:Eco47II family restriction endonuclease [Candidatus Moranbacteria bacterium]HRZ33857.1 Eco47II family restriction endonuclease [Candidatus Moranbacteria bacterium]